MTRPEDPTVDQAPTTRQLIREDWLTHKRSLTLPGLHGLVVHRLEVAAAARPGVAAKVLGRVLHAVNLLLVRNVYGLEIYRTTVIGRRVLIRHHQGIVLGRSAVIGDDVVIRQHVTLGQLGTDDGGEPRIGNRVSLGAGCTVAGGVTVGDGANIGAHALVLKDVPAGATAMVPPARVLRPTAAPTGEA